MNLIFIALVVICLVLLEAFGLREIRFRMAFRLLLIAEFLTYGSFVNFNLG